MTTIAFTPSEDRQLGLSIISRQIHIHITFHFDYLSNCFFSVLVSFSNVKISHTLANASSSELTHLVSCTYLWKNPCYAAVYVRVSSFNNESTNIIRESMNYCYKSICWFSVRSDLKMSQIEYHKNRRMDWGRGGNDGRMHWGRGAHDGRMH